MKWSADLLHSTSGTTHTCRSSSLWTARDACKQIRNSLGADQQQRLVQSVWSALLTRHCCNTKQLHSRPSRESCPASFGQKNSGCDTACKDRGGKLDENTVGIRKSTTLQTHTIKGSRNRYTTARIAGLMQSNPEAVPGLAWSIQLLVFHAIHTSYHHLLWLH